MKVKGGWKTRIQNKHVELEVNLGSEGGIGILVGESGVQRDLPIGAGLGLTAPYLTLDFSSPHLPSQA